MAGLNERAIARVSDLLPAGASEEAFRQAVGGWILVGQTMPSDEDAWSFRTESVQMLRSATGEVDAMIDPNWRVFVVKKVKTGAFGDTILVGRATSNDVVIADRSISKLHARLRYDGGVLVVQDAGSSNGTAVNGDAALAGVDVVVGDSDLVRFGNVSFQAFSPVRLHGLLRRMR
jgi:hypothetical protein